MALLIQEQADSSNPEATVDLEKELHQLVERLESKMEQIQVVRHMLSASKRQGKAKSKPGCGGGGHQVRPHSSTQVRIPQDGEVEIVTTVKSKPRQKLAQDHCHSSDSGGSRSSSQESLQMLRKMKQIQQTLQRDDLSWN